MTELDRTSLTHQRRGTGIPGLDTALCGGLRPGAVYLVRGRPGAGKTILASQLCFHWASKGERCLYLTLLAESHDQLIANLQPMAFYDENQVPESIYYASGFGTLEKEGLKGILKLLSAERKARQASLIVLDGLFVLEEHIQSEREFRRFINSLAHLAHLMGITVLLLTNSKRTDSSPEYTMVDGWFELGMERIDYRTHRYFEVRKYRGSGFVSGRHTVAISDEGVTVFPRLEGSIAAQKVQSPRREREYTPTGIPRLDVMLGGGLRAGSTSLVVGPTGIGKTAFGLHFLSQCTPDQPGLLFGFYEEEEDLLEKAEMLGIDIENSIRSGAVRLLWFSPTEQLLDPLGYALLDAVRQQNAARIFVDGIDAFQQSAIYPERIGRFLSAMANILRAKGVTSVYTLQTQELIGGEFKVNFGDLSAVAQNILLLRYVELASTTRRTIAIVKARSSHFDPAIRGFEITDKGIVVGEPFPDVDDLMTGHGHRRGSKSKQ